MFAFEFDDRLFVFRYPKPAFVPLFAFAAKRAPALRYLIFVFQRTILAAGRGEKIAPSPRVLQSVKNGTSGTQRPHAKPTTDKAYAETRNPHTPHKPQSRPKGHHTSQRQLLQDGRNNRRPPCWQSHRPIRGMSSLSMSAKAGGYSPKRAAGL